MSESNKYIKTGSLSRIGLALAIAATLSACASTTANNPADPFEGYNRAMFKFNDTVDTYALKPAATAYKTVLPSFVQTGVGNFFGNLSDAWSAVNNLLQGKGEKGLQDIARVGMNTTFGIFGLIDFASPAGIPKHNEDFGQTLGWYGVQSGPYLMLPLLGPSTVRDTVALPVDITGDIWRYKDPTWIRNTGTVLRVVDTRAGLLDASSLLEAASLDRYEFLRDGYLQRRESQIHPDADYAPRKVEKDDTAETSAPVSSEPAAKELNSGTPAAKPDSQ